MVDVELSTGTEISGVWEILFSMAAACATIGIGIIRKRDENQDIVKLKKK